MRRHGPLTSQLLEVHLVQRGGLFRVDAGPPPLALRQKLSAGPLPPLEILLQAQLAREAGVVMVVVMVVMAVPSRNKKGAALDALTSPHPCTEPPTPSTPLTLTSSWSVAPRRGRPPTARSARASPGRRRRPWRWPPSRGAMRARPSTPASCRRRRRRPGHQPAPPRCLLQARALAQPGSNRDDADVVVALGHSTTATALPMSNCTRLSRSGEPRSW